GQWGREWVSGTFFVGSYLAQGTLSVLALAILSQVKLKPVAVIHAINARPLREIFSQPVLQVSILGAAIGYAVMAMVMTATPLAILGCGLPGTNITPVIQWHVVGMFAPSFFTGTLIKRFGAPRIMQLGFALLLGHVFITLLGIEFLNFLSALILLGVGWNFAFIGGTTLLTQTYQPSEQLKVQAINEFLIFALVAAATLSAGWLYDRFGRVTLNLSVVPLLIFALILTLTIERRLKFATL
ncbi:MAG: MFS transporter, partial [Gallionellaceae bacterium]|nr:MFS transporter [Gallionellaceae bacterium]